MNPSQIKTLKTLSGNSKPMDQNLKLLRAMLELVEVDISQEQNVNDSDKDDMNSEHDIKSISFKNVEIDKSSPKTNQNPSEKNLSGTKRAAKPEDRQSRFKRIKIEDAFEEKSEYNDQDDVDFHEIPTRDNEFTNSNMMDKRDRCVVYQKIYNKRKDQYLKGKKRQTLGVFSKLIFSYPKIEDFELKKEVSFRNNEFVFDDIAKESSSLDYIAKNKNKFDMKSIKMDAEPNEENKDQENGFSFTPDNPNYGMEDNIFIYKLAQNRGSEKNSTKTADFNFMNNLNNLASPNYASLCKRDFQIPTPTINQAIGSFRPMISPSDFGAI